MGRLLNAVFPPHVAEALAEGRQVEPERREMVTIFSDLVGFTAVRVVLARVRGLDDGAARCCVLFVCSSVCLFWWFDGMLFCCSVLLLMVLFCTDFGADGAEESGIDAGPRVFGPRCAVETAPYVQGARLPALAWILRMLLCVVVSDVA